MPTKVAGNKRRESEAVNARQVTTVTEHTIRTDSSLSMEFWMEQQVQVTVTNTLDADGRVVDTQTTIKVVDVDGRGLVPDEDCLNTNVTYPWKTQVDGVGFSSRRRMYTDQDLVDCLNGQHEFEELDIRQRVLKADKILKNIGGSSGLNSVQVAYDAITHGCDLLMTLMHRPVLGQEMTQIEKHKLMHRVVRLARKVAQFRRFPAWTNTLMRASIKFHNFEFLRLFLENKATGYVPPRDQYRQVRACIAHMTADTTTHAVQRHSDVQHVKFVAWLKSKWSVGGKLCPVDPAFLVSFLLPSLPWEKISRVVIIKL